MEEVAPSKFKRICVFCGSNSGNRAIFSDAALDLGHELTSMGRRVPSSEANTFIHPSLLLPLIAAWAAASIAIFFTLCISHHRKSPRPKPQQQSSPSPVEKNEPAAETIETSPPPIPTAINFEEQERSPTTSVEKTELVIADVATHGPIGPSVPTSTSRRKLSMSLSRKLPDKLSKIKVNRKERKEQSVEDSIWMKTIILGEKCKVPSDDDEAATVYDDNGNRRRSYRPRTPRSLPVSRSNSFVGVERVHS
ncbi:hypothetical protein COCNU_06G002020 [Cocos nucifera]|uniref:Uncharacterized protein n=1 Tax=Cocos nucifera TaxID=13894 RepID=A0A8K0N213_COCNU|nr:hypothetical protein COCNU_06G002020 [Cocos nucifera]